MAGARLSPASPLRRGPRRYITTSDRLGAFSIRVLIACDHIDHQGALHGGGRQLIELTRELLQRGSTEPTVCVLRRASELGRALVAEGLPFHFFGDHRFDPSSFLKLVRMIRRERIDVLHLTDFGASTFGRLAGRWTRRPSVVQVITHHSDGQPRGYPSYVEQVNRLLVPWTDHVLAISETVRSFAVARMGFAPEAVEVLNYPLPEHSFREPTTAEVAEVRRRHGLGDAEPVVGAVTRFHPVKGIAHLIEAWKHVHERNPAARLLLVGQGPLEAELRALAARLGLEENVVFAGFQRDAQAYVGVFDISVVPSLEEGFGLVALESLALGVPVVASDVGGLPEIVSHERTGLLVPPAESEALADAILQLLTDPSRRAAMGARGRQESQRYRLEPYVDRLEAVYRSVARRVPS